jgi:4-hydroxybenzoyl-CoA thioesterase
MFVNRRTLRIEWGDCNPAGIVFYPRYFAMFDTSTHELFRAVGLPKPEMLRRYEIVGVPLVDARARFVVPSKFDDEITIESHVAEFRRSAFEVRHRVLKGDVLALEGVETRVWAGAHPETPGAIKSRPIPQEVIDRFAGSSDR